GQTPVITTVAGSSWSFPNGVQKAVDAPFGLMPSVAVDAQGNVYASDVSNNIVIQIAPSGVFRIVAGNGIGGFSGDGGPATSASLWLSHPDFQGGIALDTSGNLFIADIRNQRIRKVSPDGIITTIAGNGKQDFGGDGGSALNASLNDPTALAVDSSGNLFIVDTNNERIRKVSPSGVITTVAGNGARTYSGDGGPAISASLNWPVGIALDSAGNIFIS